MLTLVISVLAAGPSFGLCTPEPADLSRAAAQLRADLDVPGLAIAAADEDGLIAWGVAGVRAADGDDPIRRDDRFHVGSLTKAMTATLAARLVERGLLRWDSTVQEVSPVVAAGLPEHARTVTLAALLTHRSGMPDDRNDIDLIRNLWMLSGDITDQRARAAGFMLGRIEPSDAPPAFAYANANYVVAGHMLEVTAGKPWEELIRAELFEPLGLGSAGQGPPGLDTDEPHPRGHVRSPQGLTPLPALLGTDNPPVMGPAGRAHMSVEDLAAFARAHLAGLRGRTGVVTAATFAALHTPPEGGSYAFGWGIGGEPGARLSSHAGSNTRWFALMFVLPDENLAVAVVMNAVPDAEEPVDPLERVRAALIDGGLIGPAETDPNADAPNDTLDDEQGDPQP